MRKVTTINLNPNAYQIDEDGYEALRQYLENAERALAKNPDRVEILADLEQAIADKCRLALGSYKTVVSAVEIERILKEMGPVVGSSDDAAASAGGASSSGATFTSSGGIPRPRRLYRILDDQKWTGVCSGLAAYAGVDATWVRVAFVMLTIFTGGFWLIAYFVLVFAMPVASTPEEIAAAHGQPFNAQELVDRVKKKHEDFRSERQARRMNRRSNFFAPHPAAAAAVPPRPPGPAARVAGGVMLPVFTLLSAGWFAVMAVAVFILWHSYRHVGIDLLPGDWDVSDMPRWLPIIALIAVYALLALPIGAGRRAALYYANGGRLHGWADAWSGLLWIAIVAILLAAAWLVLPQLRDLLHNLFGWPATPNWTAYWI